MLIGRSRHSDGMPEDAGLSLTELIVSMTLMSIVGAMALTFFVGSSHSTSRTTDATLTTAQARVAMSAVTRVLQLADTPTSQAGAPEGRFETIAADRVVFYSNDNNNRNNSDARTAPDKVVLSTSNAQLVEQIYHPLQPRPADYTTNYPASASSSRVLAAHLGAGSGFAYCSDQTDSCTSTASATAVATVVVTLVLAGLPGETTQTLTSTVAITGGFQ